MKLLLVVKYVFEHETIGELFIDGKFFGYTLEDSLRDWKIKGQTAIPFGEYKVKVTWSGKFNRMMPLVYNQSNLTVLTPNGDEFSGIRIHGGNTHLDTEGCPLVARNLHINQDSGKRNKDGSKIINWIQGSLEKDLTELLGDGEHTLIKCYNDNGDDPINHISFQITEPLTKNFLITDLQTKLNRLGYPCQADGVYGINTETAVRKYQKSKGLQATGKVDDKLYYQIMKE